MDKYEFNLKANQIKKLYDLKDYKTVAEIADNLEIRKLKDSNMINMIADSYEEICEFEKAIDILLMAYERSPLGRQLAYRLSLLSVKAKNIEDAIEFYDDFIKMAPKDIGQYILKYEIAKESGASIDELINILETYVYLELDDKWQYELAKLYHEAGYSLKCVEQCDEIILWFSEGLYVENAMKLKMLYAPLTQIQQDKLVKMEKGLELEPEPIEEEELVHDNIDSIDNIDNMNIMENIEDIENMNDMDNMEDINNEMDIELETAATLQPKDEQFILEEELGGQLGLFFEQPKEIEAQIEGQLTIGDIIDAYEERQSQLKEEARLKQLEQERLEQERIKQDCLKLERLEQERLEREKLEQERLEQERLEQESLEQEKLEQECLEKVHLMDEYKEVFKRFLHIDGVEAQIVKTIESIVNQNELSGTSKMNNIIVMGESKSGRTSLVIDLIKIINRNKGRKGRKIAKVKGTVLNHKGLDQTIPKLVGVDLIIEQAAHMSSTTVNDLIAVMDNYTDGMLIILEDNKSAIERLLSVNNNLREKFNHIIDLHELGVKDWVEIANAYAQSREYTIEEMGILALHVKVSNLLSRSSIVSKEEVLEIIDQAIKKKQSGKLSIFSSKKKKSDALLLKEADFQ